MNPETHTGSKTAILDSPEAGRIIGLLREARTVVLNTHQGPDGDGIGSEIALCRALRRLGKSVRILNADPVNSRESFIDRDGDLVAWRHSFAEVVREADLVVLVDAHETDRIGSVGKVVAQRTGPVAAIDHHPRGGETAVDGILAPDFTSTGEVMAGLIERLGVPLNRDLAEPLYAAILFDTAQFRFCRDDPETFRVVATLVAAGAPADAIAKRLFGTVRRDRMTLLGRMLSVAVFELDGRLSHSAITKETLAGLSVEPDEVRSMVMALGDTEGVEIACLFKAQKPGTVKVSLRSRGNAVIGDVAEALGGGGHPFAAGVDVSGDLDEVRDRVLPMLRAKIATAG